MKYATATAIALLLTASSAMAESHVSAEGMSDDNMSESTAMSGSTDMAAKTEDMATMKGELIRSRDITGGSVYTTSQADDEGWDPEMTYDTVDSNWNEIGEIEDLVLSKDGKIIGIVAEVGGFLDIGDKHVVISVQDLNLVAVDDTTYTYVTRFNEEQLENLQGVDEGFWN